MIDNGAVFDAQIYFLVVIWGSYIINMGKAVVNVEKIDTS